MSELITLGRSLLLITAILWAMTASKNPRPVRRYFLVQLIATVCSEAVLHIYGWDSNPYRIAYCGATLAILWASWEVVRATGPTGPIIALAASQGVLAFALALLGTAGRTVDTWILMVAGSLVMALGSALALQCWKAKAVLAPLAVLWLVLAGYFFAISMGGVYTGVLADWFSYWAVIAVFAWCGLNIGGQRYAV